MVTAYKSIVKLRIIFQPTNMYCMRNMLNDEISNQTQSIYHYFRIYFIKMVQFVAEWLLWFIYFFSLHLYVQTFKRWTKGWLGYKLIAFIIVVNRTVRIPHCYYHLLDSRKEKIITFYNAWRGSKNRLDKMNNDFSKKHSPYSFKWDYNLRFNAKLESIK